MIRPKLKRKTYLDYRECRDYLIYKYPKLKIEIERDFWNFLNTFFEINNGCFITLEKQMYQPDDDEFEYSEYMKNIIKLFIYEFGDGQGNLELEIWW